MRCAKRLPTGRSVVQVRRPAPPASRPRSAAAAALYASAGALPCAILATAAALLRPGPMAAWIPDVALALCAAAAAGAALVVLSVVRAFRPAPVAGRGPGGEDA